MKKEFSGNLSGLKPHERFQMSVKALARGDRAFHRQLVRSCPPEEVVECHDLLEATCECVIQVQLAMHRILGRWDLINALMLQPLNLDSKHVAYFHTTYREYPDLLEEICEVVEEYLDLPVEKQAGLEGNDGPRRSELVASALASSFLPYLDHVHSYAVQGVYVSDETELETEFYDSMSCMIACFFLNRARGLIAESLSGVWPAFSSFCRSAMRLEPDIVMKAFGSPWAVSLIEEFSYELEELDVDHDIDQAWGSSFRDTWQSYNG